MKTSCMSFDTPICATSEFGMPFSYSLPSFEGLRKMNKIADDLRANADVDCTCFGKK